MYKFQKIFEKNKNVIIGAIHFPPLLGYENFPGFEIAIQNALKDQIAFENGGAKAIIFENNYDFPHKEFIDPAQIASMTYLGEQIKKATKLPIGISVLWNDYKTALSIAKILNLKFIRIPVFIDSVKTDYGIIHGNARQIINYQKSINAEDIALFTDIQVKHAELLSIHDLKTSAQLAIENGSDALIITGSWTGNAPDMQELQMIKHSVNDFPILIGSGLNKNNVQEFFQYANGAIVSTSLKKGVKDKKEINIKPYNQRIDENKVKQLINNIK